MNQIESNSSFEESIDLGKLFKTLWLGKWIIIFASAVMASVAFFYAKSLPNQYTAYAILKPSSNSNNKISSLVGGLGGLASFAGVNLGGEQSSNDVVAIEVLKTWGFAEDFIKKHGIELELFATINWDEWKKELIYDSELYDEKSQNWLKRDNDDARPSSWELYEKFRDMLSINKNSENGLITIGITHVSPFVAKQWVDWMVFDINEIMKRKALKESEKSIKYLEEQIKKTPVAEIRNAFSQLIQEQHKTKMLAQVSDEYVFKVVSKAKAPEVSSAPNRSLIVVLGFILGLMFSTPIALFVYRKEA